MRHSASAGFSAYSVAAATSTLSRLIAQGERGAAVPTRPSVTATASVSPATMTRRTARAGAAPRSGSADGEVDAVGHVEPGVPPGLLHEPDQVAGQPLGLQLGRDVEVEHDDAVAPGQRRRSAASSAATRRSVYSPSSERDPAGHDRVAVAGPVARPDGADHLLHVRAEAGAGDRGHHLQDRLGDRSATSSVSAHAPSR